jgi:hypothetical protein
MIVLVDLDNQGQARGLLRELQARGVECAATGEGRVSVEPDGFEAAFEVLAEAGLVSRSPWTGEACPGCGGHQVRDAGVDWKHASWGYLFFCACLFGLPLVWRRRVHQCMACGHHCEVSR